MKTTLPDGLDAAPESRARPAAASVFYIYCVLLHRRAGADLKRTTVGYWVIALACLLSCAPIEAVSTPFSPRIDCVVDREELQLPACALETRQGQTWVAARYLRQLFNAENGSLVAVMLPDEGWSYIDRRGKIVVRHVATMDNYANAFHYGLVRVNDGDKWGLANRHGRLVVPLRFDGMLDYQPGVGWKACTGCRHSTSGEHSWFDGGQWVTLDRRGKPSRPKPAG